MTVEHKPVVSVVVALALGVAIFSGTAFAAQPRASVSIRSGSVKLSDLFSNLETGQDCTIGSAPAPGRRVIIEQPQLAAIAEQFGVDWQPSAAPARVIVERAARSITPAELLPLVRSALAGAGAPEDSDVSLSTYTTLVVPAEDAGQPDIESLDYDHRSGRFTIQLSFDTSAVDPMRLHVTGTAREMVEIPVLAHDMAAGTLVVASDLRTKRIRKSLVSEKTVSTAQDAVGLAARHQIAADSPILLDELGRPLLVSRGMSVILRLENPGLVLLAKGQAIEGGSLDDRIHVLNPTSRAVLVARVTGAGTVQVDPATAPVLLASQQSGLPQPYTLSAMTKPLSHQDLVQ